MTLPATAVPVVAEAGWTSRTVADLALDSMPVGILVATADGDRANLELHRIWRRPLDAPFERRSLSRSMEPLPTRTQGARGAASVPTRPLLVALGGRPVAPIRYRLRRDDGSTTVVRITAAPIQDAGVTIGAVMVVTDESAQYDMERLRDAFLAILGHELRTPTTAIVGGSELLADADLPVEIRAEVATTLVDEANRLNGLVEQLLRLAALEGREDLALEPVAIGHIVRRVVKRVSDRLPRLRIETSIERALPPAAADEGYVEQVVAILLDNAAKHAASGHWVGVHIVRAGDGIEVHVLDDGPGMPVAGRDVLFRLFRRGPAVGGPADGGFGIGLFVADAIVRAMGGQIWAENRAKGGADVGFALPIAKA